MKFMYVYILQCSDGSYYTGVTNDPERRLIEHNEGNDKNAYTFSRRPVKIVYSDIFPDPLQAIAFEKQVKGWSRKKKEALIRGDWKTIVAVSNEKNNRKKSDSGK